MSKHEVYSCDICGKTTNIKNLFGIALSEQAILCDPAAEMAFKHVCGPCVRVLRKGFDQLWVSNRLNKMEADEVEE